MEQSERILIERLHKGDRHAFDQLFHLYQNSTVNFCATLLKDFNEAENIVQESFITIWEIRERLDPDKGLLSYLFTMVRNKSFDYFKRLRKEKELRQQLWYHLQEFHQMPQPLEETGERSLASMIQSLPPRRRKIISLIIEEGKSHKEIAEEMNISINTVKNQMVKAKKELQKQCRSASMGI